MKFERLALKEPVSNSKKHFFVNETGEGFVIKVKSYACGGKKAQDTLQGCGKNSLTHLTSINHASLKIAHYTLILNK